MTTGLASGPPACDSRDREPATTTDSTTSGHADGRGARSCRSGADRSAAAAEAAAANDEAVGCGCAAAGDAAADRGDLRLRLPLPAARIILSPCKQTTYVLVRNCLVASTVDSV